MGGEKMGQVEFNYIITPKRKAGTKAKATITDIKEVKAGDVFKAAAKDPQKALIVIEGKIDDWEGRIGTMNKPTSKEISEKSNVALFKKRYQQFPKIGMQVDVVVNDEGFWKLDL